jgi:hypothetical protein
VASPDVPFSMWCWPGPGAAAGVHEADPGRPVLAVFLDPVNLVVSVPPFPGGDLALARFCRQLARSAWQLAGDLDPSGQPVMGERTGPRHAIVSRDRGAS